MRVHRNKRRTHNDSDAILSSITELSNGEDVPEVSGDNNTGYKVSLFNRFVVDCRNRGEVCAVLETYKQLLAFAAVPKRPDEPDEDESRDTALKIIEFINKNESCLGLAAIESSDKLYATKTDIDLIRQSNAKILARFTSWYKCMIYVKGMSELVKSPIYMY